MATLKDVAIEAGVGTTAASVILNAPHKAQRFSKETVQRVRDAAQKLNYHPNFRARVFRGGKTQMVGMVIRVAEDINILSQPYWAHLVGGIETHLRKQGYHLILIGCNEWEKSVDMGINYFKEGRVDGLFMTSPPPVFRPDLSDMPLVILNYPETSSLPVVALDHDAGVRNSIKLLQQKGHKRLLWIGPKNWYDKSSQLRAQSFAECCLENGLQGEFCRFEAELPGIAPNATSLIRQTANAFKSYLETASAFTACICFNEECARGVYDILQSAGKRIPEDVSVCAFDDHYANFFEPPLTSTSMAANGLCQESVNLLLGLINGAVPKGTAPYIAIAPSLVEKPSIGPCPTNGGAHDKR